MASYHGWLQQVVVPYLDPGRAFRDVDMALRTFSSLRPKTDNFLKYGPPPQLLICLFGILPCGMHGIPIELWLAKSYPRDAPILFVTPSSGIPLKPTTMVDGTGRVHHPYALTWANRPDSTIAELLRVVSNSLAMDPPFYPGTGRTGPPPAMGGEMLSSNYTMTHPQAIQHNLPTPPPPAASPHHSHSSYGSSSPISSTSCPSSGPRIIPYASMSDLELRTKANEKLKLISLKVPDRVSQETERLLMEDEELNSRRKKLETCKTTLKKEVSKLEKILEDTALLKTEIKSMSTEEIIHRLTNLNGVAQPADIVCEQLVNAVANEHAISDSLFDLSKSFYDGTSEYKDVNQYLKKVRELSREQFMSRALRIKIRKECLSGI